MKASSYTSAASSFNAGSCYASDDYYENGYSTGSVGFSSSGIQPVALSALLPLKAGEKVGIYPISGPLYEAEPACVTRFCGILICGE